MPTPGSTARFGLGPRRKVATTEVYSRATPEKVEITETYSVTQEISRNPQQDFGPSSGRIEIVVPYDGGDHFTRQAVADVEQALVAREDPRQPRRATIGHLLLADYARTDLQTVMQLRGQYGVIPLMVPVTKEDGTMGELIADRKAFAANYEYLPSEPELLPAELDVMLLDPDSMELAVDGILDAYNLADPADLLKSLRSGAKFKSELLLVIQVRLQLPIKKGQKPTPRVKKVSIGWPTVTSLRTTRLSLLPPLTVRRREGGRIPRATPLPVRYNPVERHLEWENVYVSQPIRRPDDEDDDVVNRNFRSAEMQLIIGHPGELFKAGELTLNAEVEIPGYLLSGTEARLYGATGQVAPTDRKNPLPKLMTRIDIRATLQLDDAFAQRAYAPYHQFVFDEMVPDDTRIDDIVEVLRPAGFDVKSWPLEPSGSDDSATHKWLLRANKSSGAHTLTLTIAVEGERWDPVEVGTYDDNSKSRHIRQRKTGQIRLSVRGELPQHHYQLTREMNALQRELRTRYGQHQGG